ncbi:MAG TPA: glycerophosphodiester phosphodiesterase family protein [Ktedonobacterales bacterium]|nr:glycerophosphodiester phosphodiesterase family protein [Ktedonobacterales bacterium]
MGDERQDAGTESRGPRRPLVCYAHRGARAHAPENTLLAFSLAFDLGADAIECDVQRSRDGQLVIIHDGTVDRTTDGSGFVSEQGLGELRGLDAGRKWRVTQRIPTLEETLALVWERGGAVNLEIKGESIEESVETARFVEPVLREQHPAFRKRLLISSFEHPAIALLKERLPWLRIGALYGSAWRRRDLITPALALHAEAIHPALSLVNPGLIRRAHDAGLRVNVWTANRPATIEQLIRWEVDGVFSDYPERVVIVRARQGAGATA